MMDSIPRQQGIGIIEILVTLFILSVGLLGVASLQLVGSFTNAEALSRTQAEFVAEQAVERLRAAAVIDTNADGFVLDSNYFNPDNYNFTGLACAEENENNPFECFCNTRPTKVPNCEGNECSESQMATFDAWALSCSAVQANPNTQINVNCTDNLTVTDALACSPGSFVNIQLRWPLRGQNRTGNNNTEEQNDPRCAQDNDQAFSCITKAVIF